MERKGFLVGVERPFFSPVGLTALGRPSTFDGFNVFEGRIFLFGEEEVLYFFIDVVGVGECGREDLIEFILILISEHCYYYNYHMR